jgi:hypothetical protein
MLWINCFKDSPPLLERDPQGDSSMAVNLPETDEEVVAALIDTPETSAALARLFMAGATAGERAVRAPKRDLRTSPPEPALPGTPAPRSGRCSGQG